MQSQTKFSFTRKLTESAVMLALTVVLSFFKLVDLPYGGSITLFSMLPVILIAYRHGLTWGLMTGFANGVLQLLMGLKSLSYATSAGAVVAIILLDYLLAFTVTGFGGVRSKPPLWSRERCWPAHCAICSMLFRAVRSGPGFPFPIRRLC